MTELDHYTTMVKQAAADLATALRRKGTDSGVVVWAIPTYGREAGRIVVTTRENELPGALFDRPAAYIPKVIRPNDNRAHTATSWGWVPFSVQFDVLWRACRREPILPVEGVQ